MATYDMGNLFTTMNNPGGQSNLMAPAPGNMQLRPPSQTNFLPPLEGPVHPRDNPLMRGNPLMSGWPSYSTFNPGVYNNPPAYPSPIPPAYTPPVLPNQPPRYNAEGGGVVTGMVPGTGYATGNTVAAGGGNFNGPALNQSGPGGSDMLRTYLNALMQLGRG